MISPVACGYIGIAPAYEFSQSGTLASQPSDCECGGATTGVSARTEVVAVCALRAAVNRAITSSPSPIE
jgi:hypothetical protein